jgi:pyruvate,water dikinase
MTSASSYILDFDQITLADRAIVGDGNASLGELFNSLRPLGIGVPDGFAVTVDAYRHFLGVADLDRRLAAIMQGFDPARDSDLEMRSLQARAAILSTPMPADLVGPIIDAYGRLCSRLGSSSELAVRPSVTTDDLPVALFDGEMEIFVTINDLSLLVNAVRRCYASLFSSRAIDYRARHGLDHSSVVMSVGVQPMVRSDLASAGEIVTADPDSGFRDAVVVTGAWGLGTAVLQGIVTPDEWTVFRPTLLTGHRAIVDRKLGSKETRTVYDRTERETRSIPAKEERSRFSLDDDDVLKLARWGSTIEDHYARRRGARSAMRIEWGKDGPTGDLFILQARPQCSRANAPSDITGSTIGTSSAGDLSETHTVIMLDVDDPARAFHLSMIPNGGVGLARIEAIVAKHIGIHPMAMLRHPDLKNAQALGEITSRIGGENPREYFVRRLSEGIGRIAAAFHPKPVFVRTGDYLSNVSAQLLGGEEFEPEEENPLLGFRGAARYYDPCFTDVFAMECEAIHRARCAMGLKNIRVMIPFCRTTAEADRVIETMASNGLRRKEEGLEIHVMCQLPSNVVCASAFLRLFDGYTIDSDELAEHVLGIDPGSKSMASFIEEGVDAVRAMIELAIMAARRARRPIGICGHASSADREFTAWLVEHGIDSITLDPETAVRTGLVAVETEAGVRKRVLGLERWKAHRTGIAGEA